MTKKPIVIHWFRQDLRLTDNPALQAASQAGEVLPLYILDDTQQKPIGAASRAWLFYSLRALSQQLQHKLIICKGNPGKIFAELIKQYNIQAVYWNRCYEPEAIARDKQIKQQLADHDVEAHSFNGSLLWEPWQALKKDGTPYRVFTPYYRRGCLLAPPPREPIKKPRGLSVYSNKALPTDIDSLALLPQQDWHQSMMQHWSVGETAAKKQLQQFIEYGLDGYGDGRNFPAKPNISQLSPYLHWGEISPHQVWYTIKQLEPTDDNELFLRQLVWREFSYSLLYHNPTLNHQNLQTKFDRFPWKNNQKKLKAWQQGMTGYPIVDAGMRQLWQTGYMHNRVRMVVGSFLVKNLLLHWHHGEQWFWDCLVDADLANNSASWQWIAGCGADAAPYFRVFNPITQGEKFDRDGSYTRQWVPELASLPDKYLFCPWLAPEAADYPTPIVDLKHSRKQALAAYQSISQSKP